MFVLSVFILAISGFLLLARFMLMIVTVNGSSMLPTLVPGDRVLVLRHVPVCYLRRNSIVVSMMPPLNDTIVDRDSSPYIIKRLIALPGDNIRCHIADLHEVWRLSLMDHYDDQGYRTWFIQPNHCFLKGDSHGADSMIWGPIPLKLVRGVVIRRLLLVNNPTVFPDSDRS